MLSTEALALGYALEADAVDLTEARAWACLHIAKLSDPSSELLDLAVEVRLADAVSLLHVLGQKADCAQAGKLAYRYLHRAIAKGTLSHERAAQEILRLARDSCAPSEEAASRSWHFDDAFFLAEHETYGTVAEVKADVEEHLKRFAV